MSEALAPVRKPEDLFEGSGESAALMRSIDWASTPLGPVEGWPQSMRAMIPSMLASSFAMRIVWGPQYIMLYNDGYRPVLGASKHPRAMGRPTGESFPELWHIVLPLFQKVYAGQTVALDDAHLPLHRYGYLEECYFTLSYSPMRDDEGRIAGLLGVVHETTERVLAERRLRTLRALAAHAAAAVAGGMEAAARGAVQALAGNAGDVPFALLYLDEGGEARLAAAAGVAEGSLAAPQVLPLAPGQRWPLFETQKAGHQVVQCAPQTHGALPGGTWPEPATRAVVIPLQRAGLSGYLVAGLGPRRAFDAVYSDFCELAAGHIASAVVSARLHEEERQAARVAQLGAAVGNALAGGAAGDPLQLCAAAIAGQPHLSGAQLWIQSPATGRLSLAAEAGQAPASAAAHAERVAAQGELVSAECASAGFPLLAGGKLLGVLAVATQGALDQDTLLALRSVCDALATGLERRQIEEERAVLLAREQAALAEAERQRARLFTLFQQAPAAICLMRGADHVFEFANPRYQELVGKRDLAGKPLREALPEVAPLAVPLLDGVLQSGQPFFGNEFEAPLLRNGRLEHFFFNFIYQPLFDGEGRAEGVAVVAFDVTEQVRARRKAEGLSQALEATNRDLDQFAYVASHDLKAPLRGIANLSEWIEEALAPVMAGETRQQMTLLRGRVHRLEAMIDGIPSYSRASRTREKLEEVDTSALLHECRDLLAPPPTASVILSGSFPVLQAERVPLQQVFMNLISNALKHAKKPGLRVEVRCAEAGAFHDFTVADDGPGIAPQFHERIWAIFQTLQARDKVEGTGIGLSVVKKIVETRGGRVSLESAPGQGATFHVFWPRQPRGAP